jgi:hypothetical protein
MQRPLEFIPDEYRNQIFFTLLALTLVLFTVFRLLDQPLRTRVAQNYTF